MLEPEINLIYNFLSVGRDRYGIDLFTNGSNGNMVDVDTALSNVSIPLCWAGSHKILLHQQSIQMLLLQIKRTGQVQCQSLRKFIMPMTDYF